MTRTPQHVLEASGSRLSQLVRRAEALDRLTLAVRQLLPPALGPRCLATAFGDGCLTIYVDSAAWTTRIRFYQNGLKAGLKQRFDTPVRRVRVKVLPRAEAPAAAPATARPLSNATRVLLRTTANGIDDPELAASLRRLGRETR